MKVGTDSEDPRISANWPAGPVVRQKAIFSSTGRDAFSFSRKKRMGGAKPPGFPGTPVLTGKGFAPRRSREAAGLPRHPAPREGEKPAPRHFPAASRFTSVSSGVTYSVRKSV